MVETNFYGKHLVKSIPTPNVFVVGNIAPSEFLDYIATGRWNIWEVFPIPNDTIYKHKIYTENKIKVHKRDSLVTVEDGKIIYTKLVNATH